jgi:hypothetical protein
VKKFAGILYLECLAPAEFVDYDQVLANFQAPRWHDSRGTDA